GPLEILGYIQLAYDGGHEVDENEFDLISIDTPLGIQDFEIPRVVYLSETERMERVSGRASDE
ncbi:MAG TPA: hypothetical protein DCM07_02840, partial [Planctomycetaceae bacterium]|nr:hypothetical protein [Planctomycetaceae bacterium]